MTSRDRFEIRRGKDLLAHARQSGTTLGGIVKRAEELSYQPVPTISAVAPPWRSRGSRLLRSDARHADRSGSPGEIRSDRTGTARRHGDG
ncbi:M81 family metallopeptidase [Mesorhizobium atlanticum]